MSSHVRDGDPSIESFRGVFIKVRRSLGTTAFGSNEVRLPHGSAGIRRAGIAPAS